MGPEADVDFTDRLREVAGTAVGDAFDLETAYHSWLWKWLRISDQESLEFVRETLAAYGLVEMPPAGWIVNRGFDEYVAVLGGQIAESLEESQRKALGGHVDPSDPSRYVDSGSGNNTALYEAARPWIQGVGVGLGLNFAVDQTLDNWVREPIRSSPSVSYRSGTLASALLAAEILSVAEAAQQVPKDRLFDPYSALAASAESSAGTVMLTEVVEVLRNTRDATAEIVPADADGGQLVALTALGFLVDALAGRVVVPNGMSFHYEWDELSPEVFEGLELVLRHGFVEADVVYELVSRWSEMEDLKKRIVFHRANLDASPTIDMTLLQRLRDLGDVLRRIGFESRALGIDDRIVSSLHGVGNALWCWSFFLDDVNRWATDRPSLRCAYEGRELVRAWLKRPWGVLRMHDMRFAMARLGRLDDEVPRLIGPIAPLLRTDVEAFLPIAFPYSSDGESRLRLFIERRCRLRDLRSTIRYVTYDESDDAELARTLIDLMVISLDGESAEQRSRIVTDRLEPVRSALINGRWLGGLQNGRSMPLLTRRQLGLVAQYQTDPASTISRLFEFTTNSIAERLAVYPV